MLQKFKMAATEQLHIIFVAHKFKNLKLSKFYDDIPNNMEMCK